jgi:hypothetical protein
VRRTSIPVLLVSLALAAGCSSDGADPGTTTSPTSATTSGSESDSPSTSSAPDDVADVATGIRLSLPNSTVRAPEDWTHSEDLTRYEDGANSTDNLSFMMLGEINAFGSDASADELAQNRIKANLYPKAPKVLPVSELDGTEAYHVAGFVTPQQYLEEFGTIVRDRIVTLTFSFNNKVSKSERDEVVASVLPTFQWK